MCVVCLSVCLTLSFSLYSVHDVVGSVAMNDECDDDRQISVMLKKSAELNALADHKEKKEIAEAEEAQRRDWLLFLLLFLAGEKVVLPHCAVATAKRLL